MAELKDQKIAELKTKSLDELQKIFEELFGKKTDSTNKVFLRRKVAYKLQENMCGELSKEARAKIAELNEKYDPVNNKTLRPQVSSAGKDTVAIPFMRDKRLPIPGTIIHKKYKGKDVYVKVLEKGFEYNDKFYRSLTAIAQELTDAHWNGFSFFNL